jgi:hypothetical protein
MQCRGPRPTRATRTRWRTSSASTGISCVRSPVTRRRRRRSRALGGRSLAGACANSPTTWSAMPPGHDHRPGTTAPDSAPYEVSRQRTRAGKESKDPDFDTRLDRQSHPTYHRTEHPLTPRVLQPRRRPHPVRTDSIRKTRLDGARSTSSWTTCRRTRPWASGARSRVELGLTPINTSWANPIEAQFGPLRMFAMADSDTPTKPSWQGKRRHNCAGACHRDDQGRGGVPLAGRPVLTCTPAGCTGLAHPLMARHAVARVGRPRRSR